MYIKHLRTNYHIADVSKMIQKYQQMITLANTL